MSASRPGPSARGRRPPAARGAGRWRKARSYEDALTSLAQAEALARALDPATQRTVAEAARAHQERAAGVADATARAQRIEQALQEGARLLEEGKATEAVRALRRGAGAGPAERARPRGQAARPRSAIRATTTREKLGQSFQEGKALFEAGQYEEALDP